MRGLASYTIKDFLGRGKVREGPLKGKTLSQLAIQVPSGATWCDGISVPVSESNRLVGWAGRSLKNPFSVKAKHTLPEVIQRFVRDAWTSIPGARHLDVQFIGRPSEWVWGEMHSKYKYHPDNKHQDLLDQISLPQCTAWHSTIDYHLMVTAFSGAEQQRAAWLRCTAGLDKNAVGKPFGFEEIYGRWLDLQHRVVRDHGPINWFKNKQRRFISEDDLFFMSAELQREIWGASKLELDTYTQTGRSGINGCTAMEAPPLSPEHMLAVEDNKRMRKTFGSMLVHYHATVRAEVRVGM